MLLVVVLEVWVAVGALAAVRGARAADSVAPMPAGCPPVLNVVATAPWPPLWVCSHATKLLAALPETDCATDGVIAAHGSLEAWPATTSSPVMRLTRLPVESVTSQMYDTLVPLLSFAATM
jgi:hypothetical protein